MPTRTISLAEFAQEVSDILAQWDAGALAELYNTHISQGPKAEAVAVDQIEITG